MNVSELEKKYNVLKVLGTGSYGRVYLCQHKTTPKGMDDLVAIKRIECKNVQEVNEFLKEIVEIRDLRHENIVRYHKGFIDQTEDRFFVNIVMEYLPGFQIRDILTHFDEKTEGSPLPLDRPIIPEKFLIHILSQMANCLEEIHRKRIIHRDISTNNIMVLLKKQHPDSNTFKTSKPLSPLKTLEGDSTSMTENPTTPKLSYTIPELVELPTSTIQFKLLDFGFVRKLNEGSLTNSYSVGTPDFQAPEILLRHPYNHLVDVFSLGGVIFSFAMAKEAHVYATITEHSNDDEEEEEEKEGEEDGEQPIVSKKTRKRWKKSSSSPHPLYDVLRERGYSSSFLSILFKMLEIDPEKRIQTSELKRRIDTELLNIMKEKDIESLERNRIETEKKWRIKNENDRNISVFENETIVSVNQSFHLSLWNWRKQKKVNSRSTIRNAHSWRVSDIMSLSPGSFYDGNISSSSSTNSSMKRLLVSGGSKINLIQFDCEKLMEGEDARKSSDGSTTPETNEFSSDIIKTFKGDSKIEVVCPIIVKGKRCTSLFSSGSMRSTIEIWNGEEEKSESSIKLKGHTDSVISLCSFFDGRRLGSGSKDRHVKIWDLESQKCLTDFRDTKFISGLQYFEERNLFAYSNSYGMNLRFYDLRMKMDEATTSLSPLLIKNHRVSSIALTQFITGFRFMNDNKIVIGDNLRLNCYDIRYLGGKEEDGESIRKCWTRKKPVNDIMELSHDENVFATCSKEGMITVWNVNDGKVISKMEEDVGGMFESRTCICWL